MRKIPLIVALLPFAALAQQSTKTNTDKHLKSFALHHKSDMVIYYSDVIIDNKKSKSIITIPGPGDLNFGKDTAITFAQKAANAAKKPDWDKGYMTADFVTLTCPAYPDLKADKFVYDQNTDKVRLTGHITLVDHGAEKYIGEVAYLDFSEDTYKIEGLK